MCRPGWRHLRCRLPSDGQGYRFTLPNLGHGRSCCLSPSIRCSHSIRNAEQTAETRTTRRLRLRDIWTPEASWLQRHHGLAGLSLAPILHLSSTVWRVGACQLWQTVHDASCVQILVPNRDAQWWRGIHSCTTCLHKKKTRACIGGATGDTMYAGRSARAKMARCCATFTMFRSWVRSSCRSMARCSPTYYLPIYIL